MRLTNQTWSFTLEFLYCLLDLLSSHYKALGIFEISNPINVILPPVGSKAYFQLSSLQVTRDSFQVQIQIQLIPWLSNWEKPKYGRGESLAMHLRSSTHSSLFFEATNISNFEDGPVEILSGWWLKDEAKVVVKCGKRDFVVLGKKGTLDSF